MTSTPPQQPASSSSSGLSGFLSRWGGSSSGAAATASSSSPAVDTAAELEEVQRERRSLQERVQKLEVEKSLLKDLVDKAYGAESEAGETEEEASAVRRGLLEWQSEKAALSVELEQAQESRRKAEKTAQMQEKRTTVFEGEVTRLQAELREADAQVVELQKSQADYNAVSEKAERMEAELRQAQETVEALMGRVSDVDKAKDQTERDLTAIVHKTASASTEMEHELSTRTEQLNIATQEVARLKAALAHAEAAQTAKNASFSADAAETAALATVKTQELEAAQTRIEELEAELDVVKVTSTTDLRELREKYGEACSECESLHNALDSEEASSAALRKSLEETIVLMKKFEAEAERVREKLVETQTELGEYKVELESVGRERADLEAAVKDLRADLEQANADADHARSELGIVVDTMEGRKGEWDEERATLTTQVNDLTERVAEAEGNAEIKLRVANARVKDLQSQLAKAVTGGGGAGAAASGPRSSSGSATGVGSSGDLSAADVAGNTLHEENLRLIGRVASLQEQIWTLQTGKEAADDEARRLNEQLAQKTAVIRAHFEETARRLPPGSVEKKKGGAFSLFNSSKEAEVAALLQAQLEEALADKLQLHEANTQLRTELNAAYMSLDRAVLLGFDPDDAEAVAEAEQAALDASPPEPSYHDDPAASAHASPDGHHQLPPRHDQQTPAQARGHQHRDPTLTPGMNSARTAGTPQPSHLAGGDGFD